MLRAKSASFLISAAKPDGFPPDTVPEIAFVGRSNVGKSSLLNVLTGQKALARTSRTPGRTRLLNWFNVVPPRGQAVAFVDLPGYGFAKGPSAERKSWQPLVQAYLGKRDSLSLVLLLVDIRRGPEQEELDLAGWLAEEGVPVTLVVTKADKLPKAKRFPAAQAARRALGLKRDPLLFSALSLEGTDDLWRVIMAHAKPPAEIEEEELGDAP